MTTFQSVQHSIDQLVEARGRQLVQNRGFTAPLLGANEAVTGPTALGGFSSVGSLAIGIGGRLAIGDSGVSLLGGVSYGQENYQDIRASNVLSGALAIRYEFVGLGPSHPFVEVGGSLDTIGQLVISRTYADGTGVALGRGQTRGSASGYYGRVGWVFAVNPTDQLALYGEYGYSSQRIGAYLEPLSMANPFEALVAGGTDSMDIAKLGVKFNHGLGGNLELGLNLGVAESLDVHEGVNANVDGIGPVAPTTAGDQTWAEYGAKLTYRLKGGAKIGVFFDGASGGSSIGTSIHGGIAFDARF
jgi:fibronectin-binding autotransporter adhesin